VLNSYQSTWRYYPEDSHLHTKWRSLRLCSIFRLIPDFCRRLGGGGGWLPVNDIISHEITTHVTRVTIVQSARWSCDYDDRVPFHLWPQMSTAALTVQTDISHIAGRLYHCPMCNNDQHELMTQFLWMSLLTDDTTVVCKFINTFHMEAYLN
jgi:hypothetical protein